MINSGFYINRNLANNFTKLSHYPRREYHNIVAYVQYTCQEGDNAYTLAKKYFGKNGEHYWTFICDLNGRKLPEDFRTGEEIKIPTVVVSETTKRVIRKTVENI